MAKTSLNFFQKLSRRTIIVLLVSTAALAGILIWLIVKNGYIGADTADVFQKTERDSQRKEDLSKLKNAIDGYYTAFGEFPPTDGFIAVKDLNAGIPASELIDLAKESLTYAQCVQKYGAPKCPSNEALAETLLPAKLIDKIPCDQDSKACDSSGFGSYMYYRDDYSYCPEGGSADTYGLYAKLESPTRADLITLEEGACSKHKDVKDNRMNYRLSGSAEEAGESVINTLPNMSYPHAPEHIISLVGKQAYLYKTDELPAEFQELLQINLKKGWNTIALPYLATVKKADEGLFGNLPTYQNNLHLYGWDKAWKLLGVKTENYIASGYLVYSPSDMTANISNAARLVFYDDASPIEIPLALDKTKTGGEWNLIGNPHFKSSPVENWLVEYQGRQVKFENADGWIHNKINGEVGVMVVEGGKTYSLTDEVKPLKAFWLATKLEGVKLIIP